MRPRSALAAAVVGAGVGVLGGLIGLGGAEFRLPLLVGFFVNPLRRAIGLNLGISLVTVLAALAGRLAAGSPPPVPLHLIVALIGGGAAGAYVGASWLISASSLALWRGVRGLLAVIGVLLLTEAFVPWGSGALVTAPIAQATVGLVAGVLIGMSAVCSVSPAESSSYRRWCSGSAWTSKRREQPA